MDDRLQRRLRDADPLTAMDGQLPDAARLDAIKEQLMLSETQGAGRGTADDRTPTPAPPPVPGRGGGRMRPRAIGITALAATGLAAVLVVGTLVQPPASALAWDPSPTVATTAQRQAAKDACTVKVEDGALGAPTQTLPGELGTSTGGGPVTVTGGTGPATGGAVPVTGGTGPAAGEQGGPISGSGEIAPGGVTATGQEIEMPEMPAELPALVYMELHGTGAVAIFADDEVTAYCLLVKKGDGLELAGLQVALGDGQTGGVGQVVGLAAGGSPGSGAGPTVSGMVMAGLGDGDFAVSAMAIDYGRQKVGIIAGAAPDGAATVKVKGGTADGATATVEDGRFALWAPGALEQAATVIASDAGGAEVGSVDLVQAPAPPTP